MKLIVFTISITNIRRDYWPVIFLVRSCNAVLLPEIIYQEYQDYDYIDLNNKDIF